METFRNGRRSRLLRRHGRFYRVGEDAEDASGHHPFKHKANATRWAKVRTKLGGRPHRVYRHG